MKKRAKETWDSNINIVKKNKNFILSNKKKVIKRIGVYFLIKGKQVVYVGQSTDFDCRIQTHLTKGIKDFDHYTFISTYEYYLDLTEKYYILKFLPKYNTQILKPIRVNRAIKRLRMFGIIVHKEEMSLKVNKDNRIEPPVLSHYINSIIEV